MVDLLSFYIAVKIRWLALTLLFLGWLIPGHAFEAPLKHTKAWAVVSDASHFPEDARFEEIRLPDDWALSRPDFSGSVWYRIQFDRPEHFATSPWLVLRIERVCTNFEVQINRQALFSGGRMDEPLTRNCHAPQRIHVPSSILQASGNLLDIRVKGFKLDSVASRSRSGGLSEIEWVPQAQPETAYAPLGITMTFGVLGSLLVLLFLFGRREASFLYFGLLNLSWAAISYGLNCPQPWLDALRYELLMATSFPIAGAFFVQFLLSHVGHRSKWLESVLLLQCLVAPMTLTIAGTNHLFIIARAWHTVIALEILLAMCFYLWRAFLIRRFDFFLMMLVLPLSASIILINVGQQYVPSTFVPPSILFEIVPVGSLMAVFLLLLLGLARKLHLAEKARQHIELAAQDAADEMERNFARMADERVQQVTESERKRIASDLHDDLGAKLLTIVHISQNERISNLAREALEEMRLSVRGLTGRPMLLMDALGDWRAELVMRLSQTGIEVDWKHPPRETEQALSARVYVQTTRILRESVSNIIKHSGASLCCVNCEFDEHEFFITVQDNGQGIVASPDSKLDRGHGMASMKYRAKQIQGDCLVESAPGFGTVIRLTIPFESGMSNP